MVRERVYELKKDFSQAGKYFTYVMFILSMAVGLAVYNHYYFKVEKDIMTLAKLKGQLQAKNLMLKKEISGLSSPDRIDKIATQKLKMKPVDYSKVRFIDTK
ncbi:MAG: cell division protein FtsL [Aquificae bacterium]|nr:cell division protein FtsL [Aquificota bacterium]